MLGIGSGHDAPILCDIKGIKHLHNGHRVSRHTAAELVVGESDLQEIAAMVDDVATCTRESSFTGLFAIKTIEDLVANVADDNH